MNKFILTTLICLAAVCLVAAVRRHRPMRGRQGDTDQGDEDSRPGRRRWRGYGFNFGQRQGRPFRRHWPRLGFNFNVGFEHETEESTEDVWYRGPNVCYTHNEDSDDDNEYGEAITRHFSMRTETCDESDTAYKCTTTSYMNGMKNISVEVFQCCHGFTRKTGEHGCPTEIQLKDLIDTATDLELLEFVRTVNGINLGTELRNGNFTVFAPIDAAFREAENILPNVPETLPRMNEPVVVVSTNPLNNFIVEDMRNIMLGHVVGEVYKTGSLNDEQVLETGSPYKSEIRINFYSQPGKMMTANCKRVLSKDNEAIGGVIHVVEDILHPVTGSLIDIISSNPALSYMKTALGRTGLARVLREDGQYTLLAPTDEAFNRMDENLRQRLLRGEACLEKFLQHLLLPNVICSSIIQGRARTPNLNKQMLTMHRDENKKLFIGSAQVIDRDLMATNGVLHIIDDVIVPDEALGIFDLLERKNNTMFVSLLEAAGMVEELDRAQNITLFLPTMEAMADIDEAVLSDMMENPDKLRSFVSYHISTSPESCRSYRNNHLLPTMDDDREIRINEYFDFRRSWIQTAQCAPIVRKNIQACNGQINLIDKVMTPPPGNVVDVLALDPKFSRMVALLKKSKLADALQEEGPFTVFALTNQVLNRFDEDRLDQLLENESMLRAFMENHISESATCCAGITGNDWFSPQRIMMTSGATHKLARTYGNAISIGKARVEKCDLVATNGVIHVVDQPLIPRTHNKRWRDFRNFMDSLFDGLDYF